MPVFSEDTPPTTSIAYAPYGSVQPGYAINGIDITAVETPPTVQKIITAVLDDFSPIAGVVDNSDTIVSAISKITATLQNYYSVLHVSSSVSITALQRTIIVDAGTDGETFELPLSSDPLVIPGVSYHFIVADGAINNNTISVQTGDSLNNVVDGTFLLTSQLSGWVKVEAISDRSSWFIVQ